jgi:hypothetical protein
MNEVSLPFPWLLDLLETSTPLDPSPELAACWAKCIVSDAGDTAWRRYQDALSLLSHDGRIQMTCDVARCLEALQRRQAAKIADAQAALDRGHTSARYLFGIVQQEEE